MPIQIEFSIKLKEKIDQTDLNTNPNKAWENLSNICKETATELLGLKVLKKNKSTSQIVKDLSNRQKKLRDDAEASTDKSCRKKLKNERNTTMREIKKVIKDERNAEHDRKISKIEKNKNDTTKYYQAIRAVNSKKAHKPLKIYDEDFNLVSSEKDQIELITNFYQKLFHSEDTPTPVKPVKMDPPFTGVEIGKAASKLKNNKATGIDKIHAEYIKYGPSKLHNEISNLLNKTSETGEYPEVLCLEILNSLAKPPKKKEKVNVRPIILY